MTIGELMSNCVVECTEDTSIEEVYDLLQKCGHRMVVVIDSRAHRRPIGVVSERSICEQVIGRGRNPKGLAAGSAMDTRIFRVREDELVSNVAIANPHELAAVVVVDDRRQICGVVPKESLEAISRNIATTRSAGRIFVNTTPKVASPISEIPAFGWIQ
ncbi:MAG TPA: CBS domain-containing protein [Pyrinomonadaceae bacterium]|nr:CBS domain-containing protein [Pyrinomonadaceae bacterium]